MSITQPTFLANGLSAGFYTDKNHILGLKCYNLIRIKLMENYGTQFSEQLQKACELSGARWAMWLSFGENGWQIQKHSRWGKVGKAAFDELIRQPVISAWMAGTLHTGRVRSRSLGNTAPRYGCQRLTAIADKTHSKVLLIGADGLTERNLGMWRLLSIDNGSDHSSQDEKTAHNGSGKENIQQKLRISPIEDVGQKSFLDGKPFEENIVVIVSRAIAQGKDLHEVSAMVIEALCKVFGTDRAAIFLISNDGKRLREFSQQLFDTPLVLPVDQSLAGYVYETGKALRLDDTSQAPRFFGDKSMVGSVLAVPLTAQGQVFGVLMVERVAREHFTPQDEQLLSVIASQLVGLLVNLDNYQMARRWSRSLELIHQVLENIVELHEEDQINQKYAELIADYFGYDFVVILLPDAALKHLVVRGVGGRHAEMLHLGMKYPANQGITGRVFRSGTSFFSNEVANEPIYFSLTDYQAGSEICVPLKEGEQVIGLINLEESARDSFTDSDIVIIESLAGILSSVIMKARRYQMLQEKVRQIQAVRETGLDILADLDLNTLLARIVQRVRGLVNAKGAEIGLVEDDQSGVRIQTSVNPWYDFTGHLIPRGTGVAGKVLETGKPVRVKDYATWPDRLWPGTQVGFKAVAGVPLLLKGRVVGTLIVQDDNPEREFSLEDIAILELIARSVSTAIHNAQLYNELQERIKAQKEAEARLIQSERMATAGRLTASIAHEINNPLQALRNFLDLAGREELGINDRKKYLSVASDELDRLTTIVQRMLDFYRPGARDRTLVNLNDIISKVLTLMSNQFRAKNIVVHTDLFDELPRAMVVPSQIQQVLLNLVLNATEAMPNGGELFIQSKVISRREAKTSQQRKLAVTLPTEVEILVSDNGVGLSAEDREHLFEPFISNKENGIGLGLSVSYGIVQAHGGTLSLVEQEKPGACFRVILPTGV